MNGTSSVLCGASVLVVDDDVRRLLTLAEVLRAERLAVITATSAAECMIRAAAQRPEVIVADLSTCGSDASLLRALETLAPRIPVILVAKPFDAATLLPMLEHALVGGARRH